jgi:hypothetical protein
VLNHYDLGLYVESCLKSFKISELPDLWDLKYRNLITSVVIFYLRSCNLVGSVTGLFEDLWEDMSLAYVLVFCSCCVFG